MGYKRYQKKEYEPTFYFHDYETFGLNPKCSKMSQFAGIRTDKDLNILPDGENDKLNIFCEITPDYLPSPDACLVTKHTPEMILRIKDQERQSCVEPKNSVVMSEDKFAKTINSVMSKSNTCSIGYNNIQFDDECTRNILYRTLRDPYKREWMSGCSRAEGMNFVMFAYLVDPNVIIFPQAKDRETNALLFAENGRPLPSFRLEELSAANGIIHENAHDALSDVIALIEVLKLIKQRRPDIFDYVYENRQKKPVDAFLQENFQKPLLHVSSYYGKENYSMGVIQQICVSPQNANDRILVDLTKDLSCLVTMTSEDLKEIMYMKKDKLEEQGIERPPIKKLTINKCPVVASLDWVKDRANELNLSGEVIRRNKKFLHEHWNTIHKKLLEVFAEKEYEPNIDVDLMIYDGFASNKDKDEMAKIHKEISRNEFTGMNFNPESQKFKILFNRFKARNHPETLGVKEQSHYERFCFDRVTGHVYAEGETPIYEETLGVCLPGEYTIDTYVDRIKELMVEHANDSDNMRILNELMEYGQMQVPSHPKFKLKSNRPKP